MSATADDDEKAVGLQELREISAERSASQAQIDHLDETRNQLIVSLAAKGVTQVELARASGITQPAVWKILQRAGGRDEPKAC